MIQITPSCRRLRRRLQQFRIFLSHYCQRNKGTAKRKSKSQREAGGTKKEIVLELLRRKDGATIAEIAKATQWQNHSIRGFISATVSKKMGLAVESYKNAVGERMYRIVGSS